MFRWVGAFVALCTACGTAPDTHEDTDDDTDNIGVIAPSDEQIESILATTGDAVSGSKIVDRMCIACHDKTGQTQKAGAAWAQVVPSLTDAEIVSVMLHGYRGTTGTMPPIFLSDTQAADVLAWLRESFGSER